MKSILLHLCCLVIVVSSCENKNQSPLIQSISEMNLKRGEIISCGPADPAFGSLQFDMSCDKRSAPDFNLAIQLLHSFEYDEAEKVFARVIDATPECAMAYWGVAMSNFHPLWSPPTEAELQKGAQAIKIANSIRNKSEKESGYIKAIEAFYQDYATTPHKERCLRFEEAMAGLYKQYPDDREVSVFYALALDAAADPTDQTYTRQKKAAAILNQLYPADPNHPGIIHYIIHTYDYPGLAVNALPAARKYASIAPSSAHALHMPSHIFTRLGLWEECINSNKASVEAAKCYAVQAGLEGHWDEELHGQDYLVYAYLQRGDNASAKEQWDYINTIKTVSPMNFKVAYAFAAIPSRYVLENKNWSAASNLALYPADLPWKNFPWQKAIVHFTRAVGAAHIGGKTKANYELSMLKAVHDTLAAQKDVYKAQQVAIQVKSAEAWIKFYEGDKPAALHLMRSAADMEDAIEKHPVTPGEVIPAREMLGDMLFLLEQYQNAYEAYATALKRTPNRFNSLYGAALAAEKKGNDSEALYYYRQLLTVAAANSTRPEMEKARLFVKNHSKTI